MYAKNFEDAYNKILCYGISLLEALHGKKYSPEKLEQVCFINLLFSAVDDKIKAQ